MAASSHNTQPWKFRLAPDRIEITPDLQRRCRVVDPDDHHLFVSLGCAAENLLHAAQALGQAGHYAFDPASATITIHLEPARPAPSALFAAIPRRQCCRAPFDGAALPVPTLRALAAAGEGDGVSTLLLSGACDLQRMAGFVAEGSMRQFGDPAWRHELASWMRFNASQAAAAGDGLYAPSMGNPELPAWLGAWIVRRAFPARLQARKDGRHVLGASAIAVLHSARNDTTHWVQVGRCFERLALLATTLGLRTAFINSPAEVPALHAQLVRALGLGERRADLILRIGKGPDMPRSRRRPVQQVLY